MIKPIFSLVLFLSVACLSLTINQSTQLSSPNNLNATKDLLKPGDIPNPFVYEYSASLRLIATHKGGGHLYPAGNPTVSLYNWARAIEDAEVDASIMQRNARAGPKDHVPNNSFEYEEPLARPASVHHRNPRHIHIRLTGADAIFQLKFEDIQTVLNGLKEYAKIWERGTQNDAVRMCTFILVWKNDITWHEVNKGFVELIIEPSLVTDSK
ncbi:MAG: hypothetical protein Q9195_003668 [Heterodermia aff. obscurata]